jgi:SAM-dependent methyltransferase
MLPKIEILSTSLLSEQRLLVRELQHIADRLHLEFGWHYLLDLSWILSQLGPVSEKRIMDAGAGVGVMQWYLADKGAEVLSVDRASRADLAPRFREFYEVNGLRPIDLNPPSGVKKPRSSRQMISDFAHATFDKFERKSSQKAPGKVFIYNQDLQSLPDIPDDSLDAVVAVSALEHNPPESLGLVVTELTRVLKPGGVLLATLGAVKSADWFHQPSSGWCYPADSLRKYFGLPAGTPDNYGEYDRLFEDLKNNRELRKNLASFYFRSGNNGMPWGKWDPQYQPVGVCKVKE